MELPSTKPYLLRAIWEWCCDNGFTPHIAVEVDEKTRVPREFVRGGQIVLNLGQNATSKLQIGNDFIDFQCLDLITLYKFNFCFCISHNMAFCMRSFAMSQ